MNKYTMDNVMPVAKRASCDIEKFLRNFEETIDVINVEDDKEYIKQDVDLLWLRQNNGEKILSKIEIKGDRYYNTGNYFFETISNETKNTLGCFLYTEANYIFYYFVEEKELHILPMPETKEWFLSNINLFQDRVTHTFVGSNTYQTRGKLVPRKILLEAIQDIKVVKL